MLSSQCKTYSIDFVLLSKLLRYERAVPKCWYFSGHFLYLLKLTNLYQDKKVKAVSATTEGTVTKTSLLCDTKIEQKYFTFFLWEIW